MISDNVKYLLDITRRQHVGHHYQVTRVCCEEKRYIVQKCDV